MPLVYGCIAPHGGELIPELAGKKAGEFAPLRKGMSEVAAQLEAADPDTIVVASPHNLRLLKHIGVVVSENTSGTVAEGKASVSLSARCDLALARKIIAAAEAARLPVVGANYGALEGPASDLAMDWGTLIPLWFLLGAKERGRRVVVVTPSRGIPLRQNYDFGAAVARAAEGSRRRVAFVASADQAHAHRKDGPYGFSPLAKRYDARVQEAIRRGRLSDVMRFGRALVEGAKPDSLWQMAMLAGALGVVPMEGTLFSYRAPSYYGMLCAGFVRRGVRTAAARP